MKTLGWIAFILVFVGAINWGLVGIFDFNVVARLDGVLSVGGILEKILYILIGVAGLQLLKKHCCCKGFCKNK